EREELGPRGQERAHDAGVADPRDLVPAQRELARDAHRGVGVADQRRDDEEEARHQAGPACAATNATTASRTSAVASQRIECEQPGKTRSVAEGRAPAMRSASARRSLDSP